MDTYRLNALRDTINNLHALVPVAAQPLGVVGGKVQVKRLKQPLVVVNRAGRRPFQLLQRTNLGELDLYAGQKGRAGCVPHHRLAKVGVGRGVGLLHMVHVGRHLHQHQVGGRHHGEPVPLTGMDLAGPLVGLPARPRRQIPLARAGAAAGWRVGPFQRRMRILCARTCPVCVQCATELSAVIVI